MENSTLKKKITTKYLKIKRKEKNNKLNQILLEKLLKHFQDFLDVVQPI